MLSRRLTTAVFGLPLVVAAIMFLPGYAFCAFMLCIIAIALYEYFSMAMPNSVVWGRAIGIIAGCCVAGSFYMEVHVVRHQLPVPWILLPAGCLVFCIAALFFYYIARGAQPRDCIHNVALAAFGIVYIAVPLSFVVLIRARPEGPLLLLLLIGITWIGDTAAYTTGTLIGHRHLCPHISPGKTVEGAFGSCIAAIGTALVFCMVALPAIGMLKAALLGIGLNVANQFGDLSESVLKRAFGFKDSGTLLPGHGGMLDRIDSLLFASPLLYYWTLIFNL